RLPSFFLSLRLPPSATPFPYTTLFRSVFAAHEPHAGELEGFAGAVDECLDRVVSAQDAAGDCLDEFGFGGGASGGSGVAGGPVKDRKSTRLNSSHVKISYAVFCLKKKK